VKDACPARSPLAGASPFAQTGVHGAGQRLFLPNAVVVVGDFFRRETNAALALGAVALGGASVLGAIRLRPGAVALGAAAFYASEYGTHRFLFHAKPSRFAAVRALQHRLHYDHHVDPARLDLLFLPAWYLGPNLAFAAVLYASVTRERDVAASLVLGTLLASLGYEWTHYVAHLPFRPVTPFGRWMKKYHLRHHFLNENQWFGVSNPIGDIVAGTFVGIADAERSETTRVLFPSIFSDFRRDENAMTSGTLRQDVVPGQAASPSPRNSPSLALGG
jgi:hypothetical protein